MSRSLRCWLPTILIPCILLLIFVNFSSYNGPTIAEPVRTAGPTLGAPLTDNQPQANVSQPNSSNSDARLSLYRQLLEVEESLRKERNPISKNFDFQKSLPQYSTKLKRPHHLTFQQTKRIFSIPVPSFCPGLIRPDFFCTPNLGRDWNAFSTVFPISYSIPFDAFISFEDAMRAKNQDCSKMIPRVPSSIPSNVRRGGEVEYRNEYTKSFYCITHKKGGWDAMRHYEILSAGCVPFFVDIPYCPVYTLYHFPKRLVWEAMTLPGVHFDCNNVTVVIDHTIFPRERYNRLLKELLEFGKEHLSTTAMARYVLNSMISRQEAETKEKYCINIDEKRCSGKRMKVPKVLVIAKAGRKVPLKGMGNYNSWTLLHGLRSLLGSNAIDSHVIPFLYEQPPDVQQRMRPNLYGKGYGYAFKLKGPSDAVNRQDLGNRILANEFDFIFYADPLSSKNKQTGDFLFAQLFQKANISKNRIAFINPLDVPYPALEQFQFNPVTIYDRGIVFQREIADCSYYAPGQGTIEETSKWMKRCVWYKTRNCFDDVDIPKLRNVLLKTPKGKYTTLLQQVAYPWFGTNVTFARFGNGNETA